MLRALPVGRIIRRLGPVSVFAFLAITACADVTAPPGPAPAKRLPVSAQPQAATLSTVVLTEWQRVVTNLPANSRRDVLGTALTALAVPLRAGFYATTQLADARAALIIYSPSVQGSAAGQADLDSIRLALDAVQKFVIELS